MRIARLIPVIALAAIEGCILGDIPLDNKQCPCASPYTCDTARNICVRLPPEYDAGFRPDATAPRDASSPDAITNRDATAADAPAGDAMIHDDAMIDDDGGEPEDGGEPDAIADDAGFDDAQPRDNGPRDTGPPDIGFPDSGVRDVGPIDAAPVGSLLLGDDCVTNRECTSILCLSLSAPLAPISVCTTPCGSTSDCPIGFTCQSEQSMTFCLPERAFNPPATFQLTSGSTCTPSANTCQSGLCDSTTNTCTERCGNEADCAMFGGNCWNDRFRNFIDVCMPQPGLGATGAMCNAGIQCMSGMCFFQTSDCAAHCCSDADCGPTESCIVYASAGQTPVKICQPRAPGSQTLNYGDICLGTGDCVRGICTFTSSTAAPPRQCTTSCCEDSDCAVLPGGGRCWPFTGALPNSLVGVCISNCVGVSARRRARRLFRPNVSAGVVARARDRRCRER